MSRLEEQVKALPKLAFFVGGLALAAFIWNSNGPGGQEFDGQITKLKGDLTQQKRKLTETKQITKDKARFQAEMEKVSQTFRLVLDYLPKELDVQDLLKKIYSEARSAGVELSNFKPRETRPKDFFDEVPMEIKLKGTYVQLVTFMANISKLPRIVTIKDVEIGSPKMNDGYPYMEMSGVLVGYRYKEGR